VCGFRMIKNIQDTVDNQKSIRKLEKMKKYIKGRIRELGGKAIEYEMERRGRLQINDQRMSKMFKGNTMQ